MPQATWLQGNPFYELIRQFYGDTKAARSGVRYIDHIDEGLAVLSAIGATRQAMEGYCLHPIFQNDAELLASRKLLEGTAREPWPIVLAMEYRHVANAYLSDRVILSDDIGKIALSPLAEVNDMLIADKVQNRADFESFHQGTHPRSNELTQYFRNWLARLSVSEDRYQELVEIMRV